MIFEINNIKWKVSLVPFDFPLLRYPDGRLTIGACDNLTRTIYINQNLTGQLFKKVLCHEITHAAMFSYNVKLSLQQEELIADLISTYGNQIIDVTNRIFNKLIYI